MEEATEKNRHLLAVFGKASLSLAQEVGMPTKAATVAAFILQQSVKTTG